MEINTKVTSSNFYRIIPPLSCNESRYKDLLMEYARDILCIKSLDFDTMVHGEYEYKTIWYPEAELNLIHETILVPMIRVIRYSYTPGFIYGRYKKHETVLEISIYSPDGFKLKKTKEE